MLLYHISICSRITNQISSKQKTALGSPRAVRLKSLMEVHHIIYASYDVDVHLVITDGPVGVLYFVFEQHWWW